MYVRRREVSDCHYAKKYEPSRSRLDAWFELNNLCFLTVTLKANIKIVLSQNRGM